MRTFLVLIFAFILTGASVDAITKPLANIAASLEKGRCNAP